MSASSELQLAIEAMLGTAGALRVAVPIVKRRTKDLPNDIDAAAANHGLCIFVMPPLPTSALENVPFVFFDKAEIRIRIIEQPAANRTGSDAYDLVDDVACALQWQPHRGLEEAIVARMLAESCDRATAAAWVAAEEQFAPLRALAAILAHPLQLASRPTDMVEDPRTRIIDVIFNAVYQLNKS